MDKRKEHTGSQSQRLGREALLGQRSSEHKNRLKSFNKVLIL